MSVSLVIDNLGSRNVYQRDTTKTDIQPGASLISVDNTSDYIPGSFAILGKIGSDSSEFVQIDGILNINDVRLRDSTQLNHKRRSTFTLLYANNIRIYRAANTTGTPPEDSSFVAIATIGIDYDETQTRWTDPTGSDQFWYKFTFYNSLNSTETALADSLAAIGGGGITYCSIEDIRAEAGFKDADYITDDNIARKRNAAQQRINGMLSGKYVLPFRQPIDGYVADLTTRLSAAYLMIEQYGAFDGTNKTLGAQKRDDVIAELKDLQSGVTRLTDAQGIDTTIPEAGGFNSGFSADNPRIVSMENVQGYNGRKY